MKKIDTIVCDIDGTLLTNNRIISPKTKDALIKAQEKGIKVILASGRPTSGMVHLAEELKMDQHHGFIISFNGACVTDCETNEIIYEQTISRDIASQLFDHLKSFDVIPMIAHENTMYVNDVFDGMIPLRHNSNTLENIIEYEARGGNFQLAEMHDLTHIAGLPIHKVLIAGKPEYLDNHHFAMQEPFSKVLTSSFSAPFYYEFTDKGVDKAATLDKVLTSLGHNHDTVIAFGDGHNDLTLIKYAGIGCAMGNAVPEVLEAADTITLSNDEDGIAEKLYELIPDLYI